VKKHLSGFYPQDGGESQLALKLPHCHPMYIRRRIRGFETACSISLRLTLTSSPASSAIFRRVGWRVCVCVCDRAAGSDDGDAGGAGRWYNQSRPTFKPTPTNVSVALGRTAVLRCSVDNLRDRTVSLYVSISAFVLSLWAVVGTLVHDQG